MIYMLSILLAAAPTPTAAQAPPARPLTASEKKTIRDHVGDLLRDPASAQYRWPPLSGKMAYCGWVNAKNSFGGYSGFRPFKVSIWNSGTTPLSIEHADLLPDGNDLPGSLDWDWCRINGYDLTAPPSTWPE